MLLPEPGGPISSTLCPPAAATSRARFTFSWPITSLKSSRCPGSSPGVQGAWGGISVSFLRWATSSATVSTGITVRFPARDASAPLSFGTYRVVIPSSAAARAMGRTPGTGRSFPSRLSSPRNALSRPGVGTAPEAARIPSKIGRSYSVPDFFTLAGARFTVIRLTGNLKPLFFTAARTRSRASFTAMSGRPTISKAGSPVEM